MQTRLLCQIRTTQLLPHPCAVTRLVAGFTILTQKEIRPLISVNQHAASLKISVFCIERNIISFLIYTPALFVRRLKGLEEEVDEIEEERKKLLAELEDEKVQFQIWMQKKEIRPVIDLFPLSPNLLIAGCESVKKKYK